MRSLLIQGSDAPWQASVLLSAAENPPPSIPMALVLPVIVALLGVIAYLRLQNEKLHARIEELHALRLADRDLRLSDQRENAKVMLELHDQVRETTEILERTVGKRRPL